MLHVAPGWVVPSEDIEYSYVRSSGPGGQNVNKVASKVVLRLHLDATHALSAAQKRRLRAAFPAHATLEGEFVLTSDRHRSRAQNQRDVSERLAEMLRSIQKPPRPRVPTRPSRSAKARRVADKRARAGVKAERRRPHGE